MNLFNKLIRIIREIKEKQVYSLLMEFVSENEDEFAKVSDDELKKIIRYMMYITKGTNYHWLSNEKICNNQKIVNIILEYIMEEDIYKVSSISYSDILNSLVIKEYPKDFCKKFLEKDLCSIDILSIASIIQKLDSSSYEKIMKKYENQTYSAIEIELQVYFIIEHKNYNFLVQNKELILKTLPSDKIIELYGEIKNNITCKKIFETYIINNLDRILGLNISTIENLLNNVDENSELYNQIISYLKENVDKIIKHQNDSIDLFKIKEIYEQYDDLKQTIKNYFNDHKNEIIERMYKHVTYLFICYENNQGEFKKERGIVKEILRLIIDELCQKEGISFGDIEKIGEGTFSKVYRINNKVIKLGIHRNNKLIPENPYIVMPLLRKEFPVDGNEFGEQLFIEVTERVKPLSYYDGLTPDEIEKILYTLYSKQRDIGIEWKDIRIENVGILLKDNRIYWPYELKPKCMELGLIPNPTDIFLKAGDYVVLDADLQYTEEDFIKKHPKIKEEIKRGKFNQYWLEFHNKYNRQHKRKVIKI